MTEKDPTVGLTSTENGEYEVPGQLAKKLKNHNLIDADTASKLPVSYEMKRLDRCEKHDKMVKLFCKDHTKLCCRTCTIIEHRKCNHVDEIKNMNVDLGEKEQTLKIKISEMKVKGDAAVKFWKDGEEMMHAQLRDVLERLAVIRTNVNKKLDAVEEYIKQQTSFLSERKSKEYDHNRLECEETVNVLTRDLHALFDVKSHGAPAQQFIAQQRVNESFKSTSVKASEIWSNLEKTDISLQLNPKLEALLDSTEKLASLESNTSKVTIDSIVEGIPVKLKKIASAEIQQSGDEIGKPLYTGMDFLPDGRLVVVDNENDTCLILNDQLERLGSCNLSYTPLSLVSVSEDEVAVTSVHTIIFLRVSKHNEIAVIRTVTTPNCCSICLKDNDHFIVGVYDDSKPVRVISFSGEEKHLNIKLPNKKFDVDDSTCTYLQSSDKVVFTDRYEHAVYIYYIKDNTVVVVKGDQMKEPRGVSEGPFGCIFVCSNETHSIVQLSQTGKILTSHKLDMVFPFRVCVSKDKRKLAVAGACKLQLHCFDF